MPSNVEIADIELYPLDAELFGGFSLDAPTPGATSDEYSIPFTGWVIGRDEPVNGLELVGPGLHQIRLPVAHPRPDVTEAYPDAGKIKRNYGFRVDISVLGLPHDFVFDVLAIFRDRTRAPVARIRGTRQPMTLRPSRMNPVLVTSLGRTGSTLVMKLLSLHPEIAAYPLFRTEPKVASYWADIMLALTDPQSYLQPVRSMIRGDIWWLGEGRLFEEDFEDPDLKRFLGDLQVTEIADFCRARIEGFYGRLTNEDRPQAYFAEKCVPREPSYAVLLKEMFPDTREIILVRDFRDMLCSVFAYGERFGSPIFGRESADSDEDYVRGNLAEQVRLLTSGWKERSDSAFLLRYEDLILEPDKTLESMLEYLEISSDPAAVEALTEGFSYSGSRSGEGHGTSHSALESIGRWKTDLDPALVSACEEEFAEAIEIFGYGDRGPLPTPTESR